MRIHPISTARVGVTNNPSIKFKCVNMFWFFKDRQRIRQTCRPSGNTNKIRMLP